MAIEADEERPVVGDEFGEEADDEEGEEDPERPEAAPIGTEEGKAALGQRRDPAAEEVGLRRRGLG
jgi:hypothetical protein